MASVSPLAQGVGEAVHRLVAVPPLAEGDGEVVDGEDGPGHGSALPLAGVEHLADAVAEEIEAEHGDRDGHTREDHHPGRP
jgi:hypothetical protein